MAAVVWNVKYAVHFSHPTWTRTDIENKYDTDYLPALEADWQSVLSPQWTNIVLTDHMNLGGPFSTNEWEACVKFQIDADTNQNQNQQENKIDQGVNANRVTLKNKQQTDGATLISARWTLAVGEVWD
jgi:hypothetical protein